MTPIAAALQAFHPRRLELVWANRVRAVRSKTAWSAVTLVTCPCQTSRWSSPRLGMTTHHTFPAQERRSYRPPTV
jgi:hypothetical protein